MSKSLLVIAVLYFGLTSAYILAIPPGEAPDETAHFLYIQSMIDDGAPPLAPPPQRDSFWRNGFVTSPYEWYQPPLYYWLQASLISTSHALLPLPRYAEFPEISPAFPGLNRPLFVPTPFRLSDFHLARFLSALLGLGTVIATFSLARSVFPNEAWLPEMAAGFVAFIPQFTFLHAYVTNDSLAILGSSLGLAALVSVAQATPAQQRRAWQWAGVALSIALAAKLTTWYLLPLSLLLALFKLLSRQRRASETAMDLLAFIGIAAILPLISWLAWPDLPHRLLGSPQSAGINQSYSSLEHLLSILPMTHTTFWGMFGWVNIPIHPSAILGLDSIGLIGGISATLFLFRYISQLTKRERGSVLTLGVGLLIIVLLYVVFNLIAFQPQGRYFYPVISAVGFFVGLGWLRLTGRYRKATAFIVLGLMFTINLLSLATVLLPVYGIFLT